LSFFHSDGVFLNNFGYMMTYPLASRLHLLILHPALSSFVFLLCFFLLLYISGGILAVTVSLLSGVGDSTLIAEKERGTFVPPQIFFFK